MKATLDPILDAALDLPADQRIAMVERLLESLNLPTKAEIDQAWAAEIERRVAQLDRGEVKGIPGEEVFAEIRQKYSS